MILLREFVDEEIDELKNDSRGYIQEEFTDTVVGDNPAFELVYSDEKSIIDNSDTVYRELITWTKIDNMVYEICFLVKKSDYLNYLPMVNHMINSFQIINKVKGKSNGDRLRRRNKN
jgi:hypothetical protein